MASGPLFTSMDANQDTQVAFLSGPGGSNLASSTATPLVAGCAPALQLSYLPMSTELPCYRMPIGIPMQLPVSFQAPMKDGFALNVLCAVLEDPSELPQGAEPKERPPSELCSPVLRTAGPHRKPRIRDMRRRRLQWSEDLERESGEFVLQGSRCMANPTMVDPLQSEKGIQSALQVIKQQPSAASEYCRLVQGRLGPLVAKGTGARMVAAMLERIPYGRNAPVHSDASGMVQELVDALPRLAMQPTGGLVYGILLKKSSTEDLPPSKTTRGLAARLAKNALLLSQCQYGQKVLLDALKVDPVRTIVEPSVIHSLPDVVGSPHGCRFLVSFLELGGAAVAMAVLESVECVRSLAGDEEWCCILIKAASYGKGHRAQLADTLRHVFQDGWSRCSASVKHAACWK
jgi:hypothetical protein